MADDATITVRLDKQVAERLAQLAAEEGSTPEALAAEAIGGMVEDAFPDAPPALRISDEELRASLADQLRRLEDGTAVMYEHEDVMAEARAILTPARTLFSGCRWCA